ncbi:MAG TPA: mechanosensitive ion channel family protein, partial [Sedimentisphaerales bacterium]|nr:mechanosensitive ion channel family protein [Sedimentisphaerales bacterium]
MTVSALTKLLASGDWWARTISYEIIKGNAIWRFALVLLMILVTMALGRIMQYGIESYARRREEKRGVSVVTLFLKCLSKPLYVAIFALGLFVCKLFLYFDDQGGIRTAIGTGWIRIAKSVGAIALAYGLFRLVDVIEYYLNRWAAKTATKLDDMLVPVIRKSLRITVAIIATLFIAETILGAGQIKTILLSAGVGGIAIALAAKDTIANFFGSVTIFADRPFQIDELVKIGEHLGPVEEVGFRSTKIRTLQGHLVTVPNSVIVNSAVENIGRRPFIRRTSNITITYDSGRQGAKRAVEIIKEVLSGIPEINTDPEKPPRVYFSDFNDWALNIYMRYWVKPPDYWLYHEVNERVNLEIMKRFEAEQIEFAFPSQT